MIVLRDAVGDSVRLDRPAERVVSLAPNLTETLFAIGAGDRVVGRTSACDYPPEARTVPVVSDLATPSYESILAARPDLVLLSFAGNSLPAYRKLRDIGLTPFSLQAESVAGAIGTIDTVGMLVGQSDRARLLSEQLRRGVDSIAKLARSTPPVSVFMVISASPLMSVSHGFIAEELELAGGRNIVPRSETAYPQFSREEMTRIDPEVILVPGGSWEAVDELLRLYPEWNRLRAVRTGRIYLLPADVVLRPGPRLLQSLDILYRALHGATPESIMPR